VTRASAVAAVAATTLVAWLQLGPLPWPARAWAALLLVPLPALMVAQARLLLRLESLPRVDAYVSSIISLWVLAAITAATARVSGYSFAELALTAGTASTGRIIITTLILTAAGVALLFAFHAAGYRDAPVTRQLLPADTRERVLFAGVSVTAGVCEEFVFRGFLLLVLLHATGLPLLAVLLSSGAFGVVHAYQGGIGALRAALLGALLAVPVLLDGSIIPAIAAHTLIDLLSGFWLARYLIR
jgi:uncharacterized protein